MATVQTTEPPIAGGATRGIVRAVTWCRDAMAEPFLSVLFPPRCVGCRDFESYLCAACREDLTVVGPHVCPRCGEPEARALVHGRCSRCLGSDFSFTGVRSAYMHRGAARPLLAEFKFGGQSVLGRLMSALALQTFTDYLSSMGPHQTILVTWVPAHPAARRKRGYNQAEVFARALAAGPPTLPVADLVAKSVATKHQKELGKAERQKNLRGAFVMRSSETTGITKGYDALILVDDVYTTGATAQEVSSVLVSGTGLPVYVFTFSRAVGGKTEGHD
jgi:ComF family protein